MKRRYIFMLGILSLTIIMMGSSFAYLKSIEEGSDTTINLADFDVRLVQDVSSVTLNALYPMEDSEGVNNTPTTFAIQNKGGVDASYKITLADGTPEAGVTYMKNSDVRYQLKKTISGSTETIGPLTLPDSGIIDEGTITAGANGNGQTISYELVMWVNYDANPNGQKFSKYVVVDGMQIASLDTSGANFPELADNMIPVYYEATSTTEGVWKKADSKNLNNSYKWFDYNNQMWANAVTVKENGTQTRDYYLNAANGTTISMDDITTMWVWIPRFKYVIFNGNNETAEEQMIEVFFEHGREKTGTVSCVDNIQGVGATTSETCSDTKNGSIVNHVSSYTHPAFTFGDEELTGFWMSKFFVSTNDSECATNYNGNSCNKIDVDLFIKPNEYAYTYTSHYRMFGSSRKMELYGNIHGFNQSQNATSYLDSSGNLTGDIPNDSNNIDIHLIKNMEWGAGAYLSQSKYGKYGNSLYDDQYKEIYINSAYEVYNETDKKYLTGYSSNETNADYILSSSNNTFPYNDLTNQGSGKGYKGAGASSTGTIYGVYDFNTRIWNRVMGNVANSNGKFNYIFDNHLWTENIHPSNKYSDQYSYIESVGRVSSIGKLGDATKETQNGTASWQAVSLGWLPNNNSPFMTKMIDANTNYNGSIYFSSYTTGGILSVSGSHVVLNVSRNMPWLNNN